MYFVSDILSGILPNVAGQRKAVDFNTTMVSHLRKRIYNWCKEAFIRALVILFLSLLLWDTGMTGTAECCSLWKATRRKWSRWQVSYSLGALAAAVLIRCCNA